jgi:hypothetical protein
MAGRYRTPFELLHEKMCPQGHAFFRVIESPPSGSVHATCECNVCMKVYRATWTGDYWRLDEIILPDPDGGKPIDIPPFAP